MARWFASRDDGPVSDDPDLGPSGLTMAERLALSDLVGRYASLVDARDLGALGGLFTDDAVLLTAAGERRGREEIMDAMRGLERYEATFHLIGQSRHWREGVATFGEAACVAHHWRVRDGVEHDHVMFIRYHDTFAHDGDWRFSRRELEVVRAGDR
jgi:ketosteroid isomerase-like protein